MRCSKCSEQVKPVVAVDIDGTLGDYHGHFISFAETYLGRELPRAWEYDGSAGFRAWFNDMCGVGTEEYRAIKLAYRQGAQKRSMPSFIGAKALCWALKAGEAELWITTTRPYLSLDNVVPDTVAWLQRNEIEFDGLLFDDDKYEQLANRVDPERVVAVLDDIPEMYDAAATHFGSAIPILVKTHWNRGVSRPRMGDLDAAGDMALDRVIKWDVTHA